MSKFEVYYINRVVKKIIVDAENTTDAGRNVIMEHRDIDYTKATTIDSMIWGIDKIVMLGEER